MPGHVINTLYVWTHQPSQHSYEVGDIISIFSTLLLIWPHWELNLPLSWSPASWSWWPDINFKEITEIAHIFKQSSSCLLCRLLRKFSWTLDKIIRDISNCKRCFNFWPLEISLTSCLLGSETDYSWLQSLTSVFLCFHRYFSSQIPTCLCNVGLTLGAHLYHHLLKWV